MHFKQVGADATCLTCVRYKAKEELFLGLTALFPLFWETPMSLNEHTSMYVHKVRFVRGFWETVVTDAWFMP